MIATHRWTTGLAILLLLGGLQACGGDEEPAAPAPGPETAAPTPKPPPARPQAPPTTPEPLVPVEIPANFPADIPRHPDATAVDVKTTADMGLVLALVIPNTPAEVTAYYTDSLAAEGWSTSEQSMPDGRALFADKGDRSAAFVIAEEGEGTRVSIVVTELPR